MVKLCAFVMVMLWAGTGQAALVYLDAAFASDTVAEDSSGLINIQPLTATSAGVVWGGKAATTNLYRVTNGVYEEFAIPSPGISAVRMQNNNTLLVGTHFTGGPSGSAKIYQVDTTTGAYTDFITLPAGQNRVYKMSVSPTNGDILVSASGARILKYNSAGVLQWNSVAPLDAYQTPVAYNPSGQGYVAGVSGDLFSINDADGSTTLHSASFPSEWTQYGVIHDMVFSSDDNLFASIVTSTLEVPDLLNNVEVVRTNLSTNESDLLAHWDFHVPLVERWLEYVDGQGLYLNSFDAGELVPPSIQASFGPSTFGLSAPSFGLASPTSSVLLLSGDFNGDFAGFSFVSLAPEPSSVWLLLGLGLAWKRKLAYRHSPPGTNSR